MVIAAVGLTVTALGVGTVYLPFIADRDRVRGLNEESDMTPREKREYEAMLEKMQQESPSSGTTGVGVTNSNSMWKRMNQAAGK